MHAVKTRADDDKQLIHVLRVFGLVSIDAIEIALLTGQRSQNSIRGHSGQCASGHQEND